MLFAILMDRISLLLSSLLFFLDSLIVDSHSFVTPLFLLIGLVLSFLVHKSGTKISVGNIDVLDA